MKSVFEKFLAAIDRLRKAVDPNHILLRSAERGELHKMTSALRFGADVNFVDKDGITPLIRACANRRSDAAMFLIDNGADHEKRTNEGWRAYDFAKNQDLALLTEKLLFLHGGKPPLYDYRQQTLKNFNESRLHIYRSMFDVDTLARRPFLNIGAGHTYHPMWQNVDHISDYYASVLYNNIDIEWDIEQKVPLPLSDGTILAVYSSHTIEHVTDNQARHVYQESFRVLDRGGWMRITCPDIQIYYNAYKNKDKSFKLFQQMREGGLSWENCFINEFATQLRDRKDKDELTKEVDRIFASLPLNEGCDHFTDQIDYDIQRIMVGSHINWWTYEKIAAFLKDAGFTDIKRSAHGESEYLPMRDILYFDSTDVESSVWVEARKPAHFVQ